MKTLTRADLRGMLGICGLEGRAEALRVLNSHMRDGVQVAEVMIDAHLPALLLRPKVVRGSALIYGHAHGHNYALGKAECLEGRPALFDPPLALALAAEGHVVLCPDMPGFGARQYEGSESALAKAAHWHGRSLLGDMLSDLTLALAALRGLDGVNPGRIASVGFSMGAFLSFGLAALHPEVAASAHMCGFANIAPLIALGQHDLHAPYLNIPGLLPDNDLAQVAALIAPRPQFVCAGLLDPLTPPAALDPALAHLRQTYGPQGALTCVFDANEGHKETPAMRAALIAFLRQI